MNGDDEADFEMDVAFFYNRRGCTFAYELGHVPFQVQRVPALRENQLLASVRAEGLGLEAVTDNAYTAESLIVASSQTPLQSVSKAEKSGR